MSSLGATFGSEESDPSSLLGVELPHGYSLTDQVDAQAAIDLARDNPDFDIGNTLHVRQTLVDRGLGVAEVGIMHNRDTDSTDAPADGQELVGFSGLVFNQKGQGELITLIVHEEHRRRGLGSALLMSRFVLATKFLGLDSLYIEALASTNTIAKRYAELGFYHRHGDSGGTLIYGPNPKMLVPRF